MPKLLKEILKIVAVVVIIVMAFNIHWLLGVLLIVLIVGYFVYGNRSILYAQRGNVAYMKGDEAKALELLGKAAQIRGALPQHQIGYGFLLLKASRLEEAEQVFQKVIAGTKTREDELKAQVNLATAYWLKGNRQEAIALLEQVYETFKTTIVYGNLGYMKILNGDLDDALALNLAAYEYNEDDKTVLDNLAQNYYMLGRFEEAAEMYDKLMEKSPKYAESFYFHALTLKQLGRLAEAREQSVQALDKKLALIPAITREEVEQLAAELADVEIDTEDEDDEDTLDTPDTLEENNNSR